MNTIEKLSFLQLHWLTMMGDRSSAHVLEDEIGMYVLMSLGAGGYEKVYIPTDEGVTKFMNQRV
jgi:hypothetical protein